VKLKRLLENARYNLSKTQDLKDELEKQISVIESSINGNLIEGEKGEE
jgi:hypothetical protein